MISLFELLLHNLNGISPNRERVLKKPSTAFGGGVESTCRFPDSEISISNVGTTRRRLR